MRKMKKGIDRLAEFLLILMLILTTMLSSPSVSMLYTTSSINASRGVTVVGVSTAWPMHGNDAASTSFSASSAPNTNATAWISTLPGGTGWAYPVVAEGRVFIGAGGYLNAFDENTGDLLWQYRDPAQPGYPCCSAVADGIVYYGTGEPGPGGCMYALNATTGEQLWNFATEYILRAPVVVENRLYFGVDTNDPNNGKIYCLNATTGAHIWDYTTQDQGVTIAVAYGRVYVGCGHWITSATGCVYCLNMYDGSLIWAFQTNRDITGTVSVANGKVYFSASAEGSGCAVFALNATSGNIIWSVTRYSQGDAGQIAVAYGKVFVNFGYYARGVYALNESNGDEIWAFPISPLPPENQGGGPVVADGKVFFAQGYPSHTFYALNETNGAIVWTYELEGSVHSWSSAIANGLIFVGDHWAQKLYVFGQQQYDWPMFHHDLTRAGHSTSVAPNTNNTVWIYTTGSRVRSSSAVADGKVYVGSYDDKIYCLNATTGEHIWNYVTGGPVESSPAFADDMIYVGSYDDKIYCLNATTGALVWSYTTEGLIDSSPAVTGGKVYVGSLDYKVYCLNATTGEQVWNYTTGNWISSSPAIDDGRVYVGSGDDNVYCLNATTGEQIWSYDTGLWVESCPTILEDMVFIGSGDKKIYALNATTGEQIWNYTTNLCVVSSSAVADGKVYVGSYDDKIYCLNATTGEHIWDYTTDLCVVSSPAVADGKVYVGSYDDKIYCLNATTGALAWSYTTGARVCSSPAIADGKVYVGSEDNKVYAFEDPIFSLTIITGLGGTTDPGPGTYKFYDGTTVPVTAIPHSGYGFDHWELDSSWDYSNPIDVTMNSNHTLRAIFNYTVAIEAHCYTESADVSVNIIMDGLPTGYTTPCSFNLTEAHSFTVQDTDTGGHLFTQWNTGETSTTVTVASSGTYIAYYQARYNLTITTTEGGTTDPPPGNYSYWDGTKASVTATPTLGYLLDHWELDSADAGTSNPINVTMNMSHTLNAVFSWAGIYNLTIATTTGGTTSPTPGVISYTNGTTAEITAIPDAGYGLDHWELDGFSIGSQNPTIVMMDSNHTLNAVFKHTYELTITVTTGGTTDPSPGKHTYIEGTKVTATATAYAGNAFDHWELDGSSNYSNPIDVTMDINHTLNAVFKAMHGVGGTPVPIDKLRLLAPYISLALITIFATASTAIYIKRVKRRRRNNEHS